MNKLFVGLGIALIFILVLVGLIIYIMYLYNPTLLNGMIDARYPIELMSDNLVKTQNEFTLSFWYYVEGWKYKYNVTKEIFNWDNGKLAVEFKPTDNTLVVSMIDLNGERVECVIEDVKLQKWNFVCLTLWNRSLDIILDDAYYKSCAQDNLPDYTNITDITLLGNDGFNGKLSNVYFYNYARSFGETMESYRRGEYYESLILDLAAKIQGSIKVTVTINDSNEYTLLNTAV